MNKKKLDEVDAAIKESDAAEDSADSTKNIDVNENATKVEVIEESSDTEKDATLESGTAGTKTRTDSDDDKKEAVDETAFSTKGGEAKEAVQKVS